MERADDIETTYAARAGRNPKYISKQPVTNTLPDLALALTTNPRLELLVEQGRFDLATPTHALKYNLDHLRLPPGGRERIHVNFYEAGHMMYLNSDAGRRFRESVAGFIRDTDRL